MCILKTYMLKLESRPVTAELLLVLVVKSETFMALVVGVEDIHPGGGR